jgi:hypothetical protein
MESLTQIGRFEFPPQRNSQYPRWQRDKQKQLKSYTRIPQFDAKSGPVKPCKPRKSKLGHYPIYRQLASTHSLP